MSTFYKRNVFICNPFKIYNNTSWSFLSIRLYFYYRHTYAYVHTSRLLSICSFASFLYFSTKNIKRPQQRRGAHNACDAMTFLSFFSTKRQLRRVSENGWIVYEAQQFTLVWFTQIFSCCCCRCCVCQLNEFNLRIELKETTEKKREKERRGFFEEKKKYIYEGSWRKYRRKNFVKKIFFYLCHKQTYIISSPFLLPTHNTSCSQKPTRAKTL